MKEKEFNTSVVVDRKYKEAGTDTGRENGGVNSGIATIKTLNRYRRTKTIVVAFHYQAEDVLKMNACLLCKELSREQRSHRTIHKQY